MKPNLLPLKNEAENARKQCLKKFLSFFKAGYNDPTYLSWERDYKWNAHTQFQDALNKEAYGKLLEQKAYEQIVLSAVRIESKTNLLFSFEKMALRDAIKAPEGAKAFAIGLHQYIYGQKSLKARFDDFVEVIDKLPRKQTRVLTWPLVTVFGFIGNPLEHIFLKPKVTQSSAVEYGFPFKYASRPNWETYQSLLAFAEDIRETTKALAPRDYIDLQSFIWVMGSSEYET